MSGIQCPICWDIDNFGQVPGPMVASSISSGRSEISRHSEGWAWNACMVSLGRSRPKPSWTSLSG